MARALARYRAMESFEVAIQSRFFELSLGRPYRVVFSVDDWERYARYAPRLRKSLQGEVLKLIHEIERLQMQREGIKTHPVRLIDHNTG